MLVLVNAGSSSLTLTLLDGADHVIAARELESAPDLLLAGARALGVAAEVAAVLEDVLVGMAAGRAGGFAYVVGVDRAGHASALGEHGADIVVDDLAELLDVW